MSFKFIIRDDDTSYFTTPAELESIYQPLWDHGIQISLAVIPFSVQSHFVGTQGKQFFQEQSQKPISENKELVKFLQEKIKEKKVSIMLHGYSHQYKVALNKNDDAVLATKDNMNALRKKAAPEKILFYGEYSWKKYPQLKRETAFGKKYLEELLKTQVRTFVSPSNQLENPGLRAVTECGLNLCGSTMRLSKMNRKLDRSTLKNWLTKASWKLKNKNNYPFPQKFASHQEINAFGLVPSVGINSLIRDLNVCCRNNAPFVLATHYWEILAEPKMRRTFFDFIGHVQSQTNGQYVSINNIL